MKSREWATFLRIPPPSTSDKVPALDPAWCAARGVNPGAEVVLRLLRDEVVPLVRGLDGLESYHFLIHDRDSGVPTTADDHNGYIHLRLTFKKPVVLVLKDFVMTRPAFVMTRPVDSSGQTSVGGIDLSIVKDGSLEAIDKLLCMQSAFVLALVEAHDWQTDDAAMVRQVRQVCHWMSNMIQMKIA